MAKLEDDKYYTDIELANYCIGRTYEVIGADRIMEMVEPSCGDGAFFHHDTYKPDLAYDIKPQIDDDRVVTGDFLECGLEYQEGRLFIGNPPFGSKMWLAQKFYKKCCNLGDYISFILPISQYKNNIRLYEFDLIHSEDLGIRIYTDRELHCCLNIYKRPDGFFLNKKPDYTLQSITIIEHRRKKGDYATGKNKEIADGWDYAMCNWGDGSFGRVPEYVGQYAQEVYFYCHDKKYLPRMLELLGFDTIRNYAKSVSMRKMSVMRLYKYLSENIDGIG